MREGVRQSMSKVLQFGAIYVQKTRIFVNFCKFFTFFCIFFILPARLMRTFALPILPNRYILTPYLPFCPENLYHPSKSISKNHRFFKLRIISVLNLTHLYNVPKANKKAGKMAAYH
jgi:hypothetical protein